MGLSLTIKTGEQMMMRAGMDGAAGCRTKIRALDLGGRGAIPAGWL
jgi:hypothetical protein